MKKILGLLFLILLVNSCDDGDATVQNITFDETNAQTCSVAGEPLELIYRITENRVMILKITNTNNDLFNNDQTLEGAPRIRPIQEVANVTYREYNGALNQAVFCSSPPPITPIATLEWQATEGTIEVNTTAVLTAPDPTTGATTIDKYRHRIVFKNLKFIKPDGTTQSYPEYVFGNLETEPDHGLPFQFEPADAANCPSTNTIYNAQNSGAEGLYIQNYSTDFLNTTNLDVARIFNISDTQNTLIYRLLSSSIEANGNENYFCNGSAAPAILEEWRAVSGTIEVTSTSVSPNLSHTIRLKNVTFRRGNSTFYYGDDILYANNLLTAP